MLIAFNKKQVMSFFQSSFLIYVLYVLLHILHPFKMFGSFLCSFLVSLTVLAVFFILAFIGVFFLHTFFLNKCLVFRRKFIKLPLSPLQDLFFVFLFESTVAKILPVCFGTIERNPGPKNHLKFATWNVDSLLAGGGSKKSMIEGLDSCHNFDIFGICETYFTNRTSEKDSAICGFSDKPFRADSVYAEVEGAHPRGGICLYYKEHLPIVNRPNLVLTNETVICQITLGRKKVFSFFPIAPLA